MFSSALFDAPLMVKYEGYFDFLDFMVMILPAINIQT
jgi:hypothetical protein